MSKTVYCEYGFWKKFVGSYPSLNPILNTSACNCWSGMWNFIKKSDLHFDINYVQLAVYAKNDEFLKFLSKGMTGGNIKLSCDGKAFPHVKNLTKKAVTSNPDMLKSVFLKSRKCKSISDKFGIMVLDTSAITTADYLFKDNGCALKRGNSFTWNSVFKVPITNACNSLIVIDNYIIPQRVDMVGGRMDVNKNKTIRYNLISILDLLMPPNKMKVPFHLSIFTCDNNFHEPEMFDYVKRMIFDKKIGIRKNWGKNDLKVTIHRCIGRQFHDRMILTNYLLVDVGYGFNLVNSRGYGFNLVNSRGVCSRNTTIRIQYPFIQQDTKSCDGEYSINIRDASCIASNQVSWSNISSDFNARTLDYYIGDNVNRLLKQTKT